MNATLAPGRLQERWLLQTAGSGVRVALADGDDVRARQAAAYIRESGITPVLVTVDPTAGAPGVEILNPLEPDDATSEVVAQFVERQAERHGLDGAAQRALSTDPLIVGVAAVHAGSAAGCVAGASRPSADVARAALRIVGMAPGHATLSSCFVMVLPDGRALAYGDCAVVPEPDAEQLADIAMATSDTFEALVGEPAVVAILSFSTKGSAEHASIDTVREAADIVRRRRPDIALDGELQFDAAVVPEVAASKAPGSAAAGRANVLIFPNLAAGNIAYKITERLAGAEAFGPLFQGLAAPINDLSRGCSVSDVGHIATITAVQSMAMAEQSGARGK